MNKNLRFAFVCQMAVFGLAFLASNSIGAEGPEKSVHFRLESSPSQMVKTGTTVTLSFTLPKSSLNQGMPVYYQWRKNDQMIPGATNVSHVIVNAQSSDAASYTVVVSGRFELQSAPLNLSVYSLFDSGSNGGYLTAPIGDFTSGTYNLPCAPLAATYNRYKVYMPFDGPNRSPASSDFPNTSNETNLIIQTCMVENGPTLNTAIKIMENFGNMEIMCCSKNDCGLSNTKLSSCLAIGLASGQTYRAGIYFKKGTLNGLTTVSFRWKYTNGTNW